MAEAISGISKKALRVGASFFGGKFYFNISNDNVEVAKEVIEEVANDVVRDVAKDTVKRVCETVTKLGVLYVSYKLLRPVIDAAIKKSFGGDRKDQDPPGARPGCLHVELNCFTDERFLEVLADYESGRMKERLQEELSKVGIKVEGLKVKIENMEEVNETKKAIEKRQTSRITKDPDEMTINIETEEHGEGSVNIYSAMADIDLQEKANFTRLARLLVDKGTEALRNEFDAIHPPANLLAVLAANQKSLLRLKFRVINKSQWDLLYPPSRKPPDSKHFDVSLLAVLFRNICGLPSTGWDSVPPDHDSSLQANIIRIKSLRNEVYAHVTSTRMDDATFESLWLKIGKALFELNIPQKDIDGLKESPLSPNEKNYVEVLANWNLDHEELREKVEHLTSDVKKMKECLVGQQQSEEDPLKKLAKHNFRNKIINKVRYFFPGTREWLLKRVDDWFNAIDQESILLLKAGPGFGKSVFAAKICEIFKEKGKLAACHFCDFSDVNLANPKMMLESLASQMCENVPGFKELLLDQLKRPYEIPTIKEAFRIYLQSPLEELDVDEPILIVIDGLDESAANDKSDIVSLIAKRFSDLPDCVKFLITSRPEISIAKLTDIPTINIGNNDEENNSDIEIYLKSCLPNLLEEDSHSVVLKRLVKMCEGSFLYACHAQNELKKRDDLAKITLDEIVKFLPKDIASFYLKYFKRLEAELKPLQRGNLDVLKFLEILVAAKGPLPLTFVAKALGLTPNCRETKRIINEVNEAISCLLYVADDMVTIFHKSVIDWLLARGYEDHEYVVNINDGNKSLWKICEQTFERIKEGFHTEVQQNVTINELYALKHGFKHLVSCNLPERFGWLVDVVIVFAFLLHYSDDEVVTADHLQSIWINILHGNGVIGDQIRERISWQILELKHLLSHFNEGENPWLYLEGILAHSPSCCFKNDEKKIAESLLSNVSMLANSTPLNYKTDVDVMPLAVWSNFREIIGFDLSNDKKMVAVATGDRTICLLSCPSLHDLCKSEVGFGILCCKFSPDASFLLYGILESVLDIATKKKVPFFRRNKETFVSCAFSPNGKRLITCNGSKTIKLWDIAKKCLMSTLFANVPVNWCSFDITGLFIMAYKNNDLEDFSPKVNVWSDSDDSSPDDPSPDDSSTDDSSPDDSSPDDSSPDDSSPDDSSTDDSVPNKTYENNSGDEHLSMNISDSEVPDGEKLVNKNSSRNSSELNVADGKLDHDSFSAWNTLTLQRCDKRNFQDIKNGDMSYSKVCRRCFRPGLGIPPTYKLCKCIEGSERYWRLPCGRGISSGIYNDVECLFALGEYSFSVIENTHFTTLAVLSGLVPVMEHFFGSESNEQFCACKKIFRIDNDRWLYKDELKLVVYKIPEPILPTTVYSSSFSPDSSRLATCTSDGYIKIWNVDTKQVEQRFKANRGEEPFLCWWSKKFLFVFEFFDGFPSLKKYPVDIIGGYKFLFNESQQVSLAHLLDEFVSVSQVVDFSGGLLCLNCEETKPLKILDVNGSGRPQFITLPHIQPRMNVTISSDCSFIFGVGDNVHYLWKRNSANPVRYNVIFTRLQKTARSPALSCFSNDSKILAIFTESRNPLNLEVQIIHLYSGNKVRVSFSRDFHSLDLFCIPRSRIIITTASNRIDFHDIESGACIWTSFQPNLTKESQRMKLSPNDTILAFPKLNGNMEFLHLSIPEDSLLKKIISNKLQKYRDGDHQSKIIPKLI